ncbi:unnamed protein product [Chrysoparadoxa australica]
MRLPWPRRLVTRDEESHPLFATAGTGASELLLQDLGSTDSTAPSMDQLDSDQGGAAQSGSINQPLNGFELGGDATIPPDASVHLAEAVRFKTVSKPNGGGVEDPEAFQGFRTWLEETYPLSFAACEVETIATHSMLWCCKGWDDALKPVLFEGHYDVVPVEPGTESSWPYPPYHGVIANGSVHGRGSLDDKGAVIAMFEALEMLLKQGFSPQRTVYFALGHDEEVGGTGAIALANLLHSRGVKLDYAVGEGGTRFENPYAAFGGPKYLAMIGIAEKIFVSLTFRTNSEADGHSSAPPPPGEQSILKVCHAMEAVAAARQRARLTPAVAMEMQAVGDLVRVRLLKWLLRSRLGRFLLSKSYNRQPGRQPLVRTTVAATLIHSGIRVNIMPRIAEGTVNCRLLPGEDPARFVSWASGIARRHGTCLSARIADGPVAPLQPSCTDTEGYRSVKRALETLPDTAAVPGLTTGTVDIRHFSLLTPHLYRIRPFTYETAHASGELLPIAALEGCIRMFAQLIHEAGVPPHH